MKKILIIIALLFILFINLSAEELEVYSNNVLLYNVKDDTILFSKNSDEKISIASLTKIMTAIVSIENIDNLKEEVKFPRLSNTLSGYSKVGFKRNETVTYEDLLYGSLLPSGADATEALGVLVSGTTEEFVRLMNEKAKELSLKNTSFANTYGRDDDDNYSTLEDLLVLMNYSLKNEEFYKIFTSKSWTLTNGKTISSSLKYYNKSSNLNIDNIIGSKTGYTDGAGLCMISLFEKENMEFLLITANADYKTGDSLQIMDSININNYYYDNYEYVNLIKNKDLLTSIELFDWLNIKENIYSKQTVTKYLEKDKELKKEYIPLQSQNKNLKVGDKLGKYIIKYDNEEVYSTDIILEKSSRNNFWIFISKYRYLVMAFLILTLGFFIFFMTLLIKKILFDKRLKKL